MVVIYSSGEPNPVDIRFKEVSGLSMARTIEQQGRMVTLASELPQQTLTLKRGVINQDSPLVTEQNIESVMWGTRMLRKDLLVSMLDENDDPINSWMVNNAYLSNWSWEGVSATTNDVLIESMQFKYSELRYMPSGA
jgi:phage tail-like protein